MERLDTIRTQIEYYLSDDNLQFDAFFQKEMRTNEENWLNAELLFNCSKIKSLNVTTTEEVKTALKESHLITKEEDGKLFIRRPTPLPELKDRPKKNTKTPTIMLVEVANVPEEVTWTEIKNVLINLLKGETEVDRPVRNVSRPTADNKVTVAFPYIVGQHFLTKFEGKFEVAGTTLVAVELKDEAYAKAMETIPPFVFVEDKKKKVVKPKALIVGGQTFQNDKDMLKRVRSWLDAHPLNTEFAADSAEFKVLKELLAFHPRAAEKGIHQIKSFAVRPFEGPVAVQSEETPKAFFLVREDGQAEDFSVKKCVESFVANNGLPPVGKRSAPESREEDEVEKSKVAKTEA